MRLLFSFWFTFFRDCSALFLLSVNCKPAGDFVLLCSGSSNQEVPWSGGKFYTVDKIMLWRENGVLYVFQLPARAIRPVDLSDSSWSAEPPTCLYSVPTGPLMVSDLC